MFGENVSTYKHPSKSYIASTEERLVAYAQLQTSRSPRRNVHNGLIRRLHPLKCQIFIQIATLNSQKNMNTTKQKSCTLFQTEMENGTSVQQLSTIIAGCQLVITVQFLEPWISGCTSIKHEI